MQCNFCNSYDNSVIFEWTRFEYNNILKCNNCGLVFKDISECKKEIKLFYKKEYRKIETSPIQTAEEHYNDNITKKDIDDRMHFITRNVNLKNKNVLEIGSASGGLMERLRNIGTNVEGIELNDEYRNFSKELGFNIYADPIEDLNIKDAYDVIVSFHTLEHFVDPKYAIRSIYLALKTDGIFLGEVPNQDDWRISIFDNFIIKRLHYDPTHNYYFSSASLNKYFENCGFGIIMFETVERYNSILQLRNILCNKILEDNTDNMLKKYIFPKNEKDDVRLHIDDQIEGEFNRIFGDAVNSELKGNCLRFVASKNITRKQKINKW